MSAILSSLGGLSGQFWSTLIGAVVGAVVGGVISFAIQVHGARTARNERLAAKCQEDLSTAFSVTVKVVKMMSNIGHINAALKNGLSRLEMPEFAGAQSWHVVPSFGTKPPVVTFTDEESAFVLSTNVKELILMTLELADVYNDFMQMVIVYSEKREALTASLSVDDMEGTLATTGLAPETLKRLLPRMIPLGTLIDSMMERGAKDYGQARRTFDLLKAHCEERFGKNFPKLELTDQTPAG
jgi:hypothetical protein